MLSAKRSDLCAGGGDLAGVLLRKECIVAQDEKGTTLNFVSDSHLEEEQRAENATTRVHHHVLDLRAVFKAQTLTIRMYDIKDKRTALLKPVIIRRIRRDYIYAAEFKDSFKLLQHYSEL